VTCFFNEKFFNLVIKYIELLKYEGPTSKSDTIDTHFQINGQNWFKCKEYVWAITKIIFSYTCSPLMKILQKF